MIHIHIINIWKCNPLAYSDYIKLPKKLDHSKKSLINIEIFDGNKFFKWCLVRYLHQRGHHPARTRKTEKLFGDELDFEDITFLVKIKNVC